MRSCYHWSVLIAFQLTSLVSGSVLAVEDWFNRKPKQQLESTDEIWDEWLWKDELWQAEADRETQVLQVTSRPSDC